MATLENVNGASLVPSFDGGLNMLNQAFGQRMDRKRAEEAQQAQQAQIAQIMGGGQGGGGGMPGATPGFNGNATPEQIIRIAQIDPKMAEMMQGMLERGDKIEMEQAKAETDRGVREATLISNAKTPAERMNVMNNLAAAAAAEGRPVDRYIELANMSPDQQELELQRMQVMGADLQSLLAPPEPPKTREIKQGDKIVTQQFNLQTGQFEDIAQGDRFQSKLLSPEEFAQQAQLRVAGRPNTNVNVSTGSEVGTIPPGFELFTDPQTGARSMRPIEGGPAALEIEEAEASRGRQEALTARQLNPTVDDIQTARELAQNPGFLPTTGMFSNIVKMVPFGGQKTIDLEATIEAIGSGVSLENLNQMRQASPTGGALGNVSDKQSGLLSDAFGSLKQSMSQELFLYNLARVENTLNDIVHGPGNGPARHNMQELRQNLKGQADLNDQQIDDPVRKPDDVDISVWRNMTPKQRELWRE